MPREDVGFFKKREFINFTNLLSHLTDTLHFFLKLFRATLYGTVWHYLQN